MSEITVSKDSNVLFFKNLVIGIFLLIEVVLLSLIALEYYKVATIFVVSIIGILLLYLFYNKPFILLPTFLLAILVGAFGSKDGGSQISLTDILFPIILALVILRFFESANEQLNKTYSLLKTLFLLFLLWSLFVVMVANNKSLAIAYWRNYLAGFVLLIFALSVIKDYMQINKFLLSIILWGLFLSIIEFYIVLSLGSLSSALAKLFITKNLLATTWGRSNYLAAFHVLIVPITFGFLFVIKSKAWKVTLSIVLLIMFSGIVLTLSRGGILSLGVALFLLVFKVLKPKTFIPLLSLFLLISIILLLNPLTYALFEGLSKVESSFSTFTRLNFYKDVWKTFLDYPITGVGLGNLGYYSVFKITTSAASAHNIVLGALGETGIVGAILIVWLLIHSFILSFKNYMNEKNEKIKILLWSFLCAFIGVLIHSMMEPNFEGFQFAVMFWSIFAVFLRISELSDVDKHNLINKFS